ncbi:RIP metalloprotease RseP [Prochlorococcus marinus]|uniref:Zinc metalloprotease n=1 Tax=Prochlorococcus marinus (strain MIT 9211) TaxID=93059 RepID=A9BBJ5_PROM4|nr:RIP metalloprotease RseP [Prochlorococcus marinus]ABX09207.1 Predicted membrane-associated Zn-dependent protease 1 [Prochlorococcus marinus str. MIT 9211]
MTFFNVIASIAVLALLIFFHEAGHFLAATLQGIRVSGFSIGFGPALLEKEFKGVTYSIRAFPLGGFVSFPDDDNEKEKISLDDPDLLSNRPIYQRLLVISAGVIANLLVAWIALFSQATFIGLPNQPDPGVLIIGVQDQEAAYQAGLEIGDKVLSIDGIKLGSGQEAVQSLVDKIKASPGKSIELDKANSKGNFTITITPSDYFGNGRVGAQLQQNTVVSSRPAKGILEIIVHSNSQFTDLLIRTVKGYQGLFTDFASTSKQISGPVKIVELGAQMSGQGVSGLIFFASLVSINLAVLNSLPLPVLDGGQFALILIEAVRGKPVPEKIQLAFMQSGFLLLIGLSIVLIIRDTSQLSILQQLASNH